MLRLSGLLLLLVLPVLAAFACGGGGGTVSGTVRFEGGEVELLPPGARLEVRLLDVSLIDARSREIGRYVNEDVRALPADFLVHYDGDAIEERSRYAVQAAVWRGDELLYINDTVHSVITRGHPKRLDVTVISTAPNPDRAIVEVVAGAIGTAAGAVELPAGTAILVSLISIPGEDVREAEIGWVVYENVAALPHEFRVSYDANRLVEGAAHEIRVEASREDELLYSGVRPVDLGEAAPGFELTADVEVAPAEGE